MMNGIVCRLLLMIVAVFFLLGCVTTTLKSPPQFVCKKLTPAQSRSYVEGKRYFEKGFYKRAMHELLPLACDGNAEAQYAVGYMYYYGYGVAQDTDTGCFWIHRSAEQGYKPAIKALPLIFRKDNLPPSKLDEKKYGR